MTNKEQKKDGESYLKTHTSNDTFLQRTQVRGSRAEKLESITRDRKRSDNDHEGMWR